jgi:RNA polymerase sigma-54 factor
LKERGVFSPAFEVLLSNLKLLAGKRHSLLGRLCQVDAAQLGEMIAQVRRVNPKPGINFDQTPALLALPDVYVSRLADGTWCAKVSPDALPQVVLKTRGPDNIPTQVRAGHIESAKWLISALDERARTIETVAVELARQQEAYLLDGEGHLRILTLNAISAATNLHPSTISRATADKYMVFERKLFEMKSLFGKGVRDPGNDVEHSANAVQFRIRRLIDGETASREVLSDKQIASELSMAGIRLARRTVAKYRNAMRIPRAVERRRDVASA